MSNSQEEKLHERLKKARESFSSQFAFDDYGPAVQDKKNYVARIMAMVDHYKIDCSLEDISELDNDDGIPKSESFDHHFGIFQSRLDALIIKLELSTDGDEVDQYEFDDSTRKKAAGYIEELKSLIYKSDLEVKKKDKIMRLAGKLQTEIDQATLQLDRILHGIVQISETIGEAGKNIEPALKPLGKLKEIVFEAKSKGTKQLPKNEETRKITYEPEHPEDEVPFSK